MAKYKIQDLDKMDILPIDCNEEAEAFAKMYQNAEIMAAFGIIRKKKRYGELQLLSKNKTPRVIFAFKRGVCLHCSPIEWVSELVPFKDSVKFY